MVIYRQVSIRIIYQEVLDMLSEDVVGAVHCVEASVLGAAHNDPKWLGTMGGFLEEEGKTARRERNDA